jgi:hypothetical protein
MVNRLCYRQGQIYPIGCFRTGPWGGQQQGKQAVEGGIGPPSNYRQGRVWDNKGDRQQDYMQQNYGNELFGK